MKKITTCATLVVAGAILITDIIRSLTPQTYAEPNGYSTPLCSENISQDSITSNTSALTYSAICVKPGDISLYPSDAINNDDICSNSDIIESINNPGFPIVKEFTTCNTGEASIFLGSINTAPVRQNPSTLIHDILFDDLRGEAISGYTITAEVSNFIDYNNASNIIELGTNPDGAPAILDQGTLTSVIINNGGSGYNSTPLIAFMGGGGSGATATATVSGGVITKIDVKNYGTGYTSAPIVVIVPTSGGSGAVATANIIEASSNLNPATSLPEANIFVTLDPSVATIKQLKPNQVTNPSNFITGPRTLVTTPAIQHTLFATTLGVPVGRYDLDNTIFDLRVPAYVRGGDYRAIITQTIIVDNGTTNTPPVVVDSNIAEDAGNTVQFSQAYFTSLYTDTDADPMVSTMILSLPNQGSLRLGGVDVTVGQVIPVNDLGVLTYESSAQDYTTNFNWSASDGIDNSNTAEVDITLSLLQN